MSRTPEQYAKWRMNYLPPAKVSAIPKGGESGANVYRIMEDRPCCTCGLTFPIVAASPRSMNFVQCGECSQSKFRELIREGRLPRIVVRVRDDAGKLVPYDENAALLKWQKRERKREAKQLEREQSKATTH